MKLALVMLNYNDADNTLNFLNNITNYHVFDKVIVVDNASNDDSKVRLRDYCKLKDYIFFDNNENKGYGAGNNIGVKLAKTSGTDFALIANPDTEIDENTVEVLKSAMIKNPDIGICAPLMESHGAAYGSKKNVLTSPVCWPERDFWHSLAENGPVCRRIFRKSLHYTENFYNGKIKNVGALAGALLMVRVDAFIRTGGYDENMFLYGEEDVISKKMRELGFKTAVLTGYRYKHQHSASIKKSLKSLYRRQKIREESMLYYYEKYLHINKFEKIIAEVFFAVVRLEAALICFIGRVKGD